MLREIQETIYIIYLMILHCKCSSGTTPPNYIAFNASCMWLGSKDMPAMLAAARIPFCNVSQLQALLGKDSLDMAPRYKSSRYNQTPLIKHAASEIARYVFAPFPLYIHAFSMLTAYKNTWQLTKNSKTHFAQDGFLNCHILFFKKLQGINAIMGAPNRKIWVVHWKFMFFQRPKMAPYFDP